MLNAWILLLLLHIIMLYYYYVLLYFIIEFILCFTKAKTLVNIVHLLNEKWSINYLKSASKSPVKH